MDDKDIIERLIENYRSESAELTQATEEMYDIVRNDPERAWRIILAILKQDQTDDVMACLAAGSLEDFLVYHGSTYIERVEELALNDQNFNLLLGGVWKNYITDAVWNRIVKARKKVW